MRFATLLSLAIAVSVVGISEGQLVFDFTATSGTPQNVIDGFEEAGALWSGSFTDSVTININIDFANLSPDPSVLGSTSLVEGIEGYASFKSFLGSDVTSSADTSAVSSLQAGSSYNVWINRTLENPNGAASATPYLDDNIGGGSAPNNTNVLMTTANAKALGIITGDDPITDASITFNNNSPWDFDRSDGINSGEFDFVGAAAHEIGHVLGFSSRVDVLDSLPGLPEDTYWSSTLDLFRLSVDSLEQGASIPDMTANSDTKFFSIDGGASAFGTFSLGVNFGDGRQASHWEDDLGFGIMDPTVIVGEFLQISELDLTAFDVIGWDRFMPVPEPGTSSFWILVVIGVMARRRSPQKPSQFTNA